MSADGVLQPALFHGTNARLRKGDMITVGHPSAYGNKEKHVYATGTDQGARMYAQGAAKAKGGKPKVYQVKPTGPIKRDPKGEIPGQSGDYRSAKPLKVTRRVTYFPPD